MFDERWFNGKDNKPIETIEDAVFLVSLGIFCGGIPGGCKNCAMHMYDHTDGKCVAMKKKAEKFIREYCQEKYGVEVYPKNGYDSHKTQQDVYKLLFEEGALKKKSPNIGKCANCENCREASHGVFFCKSFHNFTHEDGFCYRYEPVIID